MARTSAPKRKVPSTKPDTSLQAVLLRLPRPLVAEIDAIATKESRSRLKQIEVVLREYVQSYGRRAAA